MKLRDLEASFIRYKKEIAGDGHGRKLEDGSTQWGGFEVEVTSPVERFEDAQGIRFLCPLCFEKNNGAVGTHSIQITFEDRGVPDEFGTHNDAGNPVRWKVVEGSTCIDDLKLSPSIALLSGCKWHGYIGNNEVPPGHAK
jgi:hypothetical protein